jgi:dTDP-4-dehydrorhamnose reductase
MVRLLRERRQVRVVADQIGAPTWARSLAQATVAALMPALLARAALQSRVAATRGVYHAACSGETSWYGLTTRLRDCLQSVGERAPLALVLPMTSEADVTPAVRPKNSRLDSTRFEHTFGVSMPPWDEALDLCLADVLEGGGPGAPG